VLRWRTALIIREIEDEIAAERSFATSQQELTRLMAQKEELEALVRRSGTEVLKNPGPLLESHIVEHGLSCSVLDAEAWLRSCTYELGPAEERAGQHLYELHRELHRKVTSWRDLLG